jgi:hypothetical protein
LASITFTVVFGKGVGLIREAAMEAAREVAIFY